MLRAHINSVELVRGVFNPLLRRSFTSTSARCTDDNDRKKMEGVFSWLKDIFKSEVASKVGNDFGAKTNSMTESISSPGWSPRPSGRNFLLATNRMDTQVRGVANCSPRSSKPPIREPNMPQKQEKKEDKQKKKKKKPVLRTEAPPAFPDVVSMEAGQGLGDNPDANFRYQWGVKIPQETVQGTQNAHAKQISREVADNVSGPNVRMSMSDTDQSSTSAESSSKSAQLDPSAMDETAESPDKVMNAEKILKKVSGSLKDSSQGDEDYNIPLDTDLDAEISAWKDLALKSKVSTDVSGRDDFASTQERSADMISIRPEPPEPKLDVQAIPSHNEEVLKEDEEDLRKDIKVNMKKLDGKRSSDVHKMDSKKLHTLQSSNSKSMTAVAEDNSYSRGSWIWLTLSGLPRLNTVTFSTSSDGNWARAEKITEAKGSEVSRAGEPCPDNVDMRNIGSLEEPASPEPQQVLRKPQQQDGHQPEFNSGFEDSLNILAKGDIEFSLQGRRQQEQEASDSRVNLAEDSRTMEAEDHHHQQQQHPNAFTQFEDDFVSGYESLSLEPAQESSTRKQRKQDSQSAEWKDSDALEKESNEPQGKSDNYVSDGEYIKVAGDPYPYSKQYFEKWKMSKEDINIGTSFVNREDEVDPEPPIGDGRSRQIDSLPPTRGIAHDIHVRNQLSLGKGVPN